MKLLFVMLNIFLYPVACNSSKTDAVRTFIPGTYVRFSDHEMRREYDTLKIKRLSDSGNNYRLTRSSSFQKKLDGQVFEWEHHTEAWTAIYDETKRVLNETKKGKVISFVPDRNILFAGTTEYKKIK